VTARRRPTPLATGSGGYARVRRGKRDYAAGASGAGGGGVGSSAAITARA